MTKFNIVVVEGNGDTNIYEDAATINVTNDKIEVGLTDGERFTHQMNWTDKVIIKPLT